MSPRSQKPTKIRSCSLGLCRCCWPEWKRSTVAMSLIGVAQWFIHTLTSAFSALSSNPWGVLLMMVVGSHHSHCCSAAVLVQMHLPDH